MPKVPLSKKFTNHLISYSGMLIGAFFAALSIRIFLIPNELIDGGVLGIAMILGKLYGSEYISIFLLILNVPFVYLAWRYIRRSFVFHMLAAIVFFAFFLKVLDTLPSFAADPLEAIVIGGAMLGAGAGFIIRHGGCTDGTEILAILINRRKGFTVGQVIFFINIFIFSAYGWIFNDWHIALRSLMLYLVAFKMMDIVIAGLEELKSVLIMCSKPDKLSKIITHELGLGLTFIKGKGGYSGEDRDILFIIVERLDLAELKEIVLREDPTAFMAIENLHEVAYGRTAKNRFEEEGSQRIYMKEKVVEPYDSWRILRIMSEFVDGFETMVSLGPSVAIFGSSNSKPVDSRYYTLAEEIAKKIVKKGFGIITGGGPGVMEYANRGAQEAKGKSCGVCIKLPDEPRNGYLDREYELSFRHFFVRKVMFVRYAKAFVVLPGGYGTIDELFEALTLIKTGKIKYFPIYLVGKDYWKGLIDWLKQTALANTNITTADLDLIRLSDDPDEIAAGIEEHFLKTKILENF